MDITTQDREDLLERERRILEAFQTGSNDWEHATKKKFIQELIEVTEMEIDYGIIPIKKNNISSFLYNKLTNQDIDISAKYIQILCNPDQKGNYSQSEHTSHSHNFDESGNCDGCDKIEHNAIIYEVSPDITLDKTSLEENITPEDIPDPTPTTEYILRIKENCDELGSYCTDIIKKYHHDDEIAKVIEKALPNPKELIVEQKGIQAKLIHIGKQSDYRQKIGEFEKVKSIILSETTYNLAKVAKILSITPKHQSHNIISNLPTYLSNMKWFRSLFFECKKCKHENKIELSNWYNEQVERKTLGLDMIDPT